MPQDANKDKIRKQGESGSGMESDRQRGTQGGLGGRQGNMGQGQGQGSRNPQNPQNQQKGGSQNPNRSRIGSSNVDEEEE